MRRKSSVVTSMNEKVSKRKIHHPCSVVCRSAVKIPLRRRCIAIYSRARCPVVLTAPVSDSNAHLRHYYPCLVYLWRRGGTCRCNSVSRTLRDEELQRQVPPFLHTGNERQQLRDNDMNTLYYVLPCVLSRTTGTVQWCHLAWVRSERSNEHTTP
jgi:hypothetical protein